MSLATIHCPSSNPKLCTNSVRHLRRIVANVLALSQSSLVRLVEDFGIADHDYNILASVLATADTDDARFRGVPSALLPHVAHAIARLVTEAETLADAAMSADALLAAVLNPDREPASRAMQILSTIEYWGTAKASHQRVRSELSRRGLPMLQATLYLNALADACVLDEDIVEHAIASLVAQARYPRELRRTLRTQYDERMVQRELGTEELPGRVVLTTGTLAQLAASPTCAESTEYRDLLIERLIDLIETHGVEVAVIDDSSEANSNACRHAFAGMSALLLYRDTLLVTRTHPNLLCLAVTADHPAELARRTEACERLDRLALWQPADRQAALRYLHSQLSYTPKAIPVPPTAA
jgi:hypothetical protein